VTRRNSSHSYWFIKQLKELWTKSLYSLFWCINSFTDELIIPNSKPSIERLSDCVPALWSTYTPILRLMGTPSLLAHALIWRYTGKLYYIYLTQINFRPHGATWWDTRTNTINRKTLFKQESYEGKKKNMKKVWYVVDLIAGRFIEYNSFIQVCDNMFL